MRGGRGGGGGGGARRWQLTWPEFKSDEDAPSEPQPTRLGFKYRITAEGGEVLDDLLFFLRHLLKFLIEAGYFFVLLEIQRRLNAYLGTLQESTHKHFVEVFEGYFLLCNVIYMFAFVVKDVIHVGRRIRKLWSNKP